MLVEDDQKLARLIASFPSQHGFEVHQVHRGDVVLATFLDFRPQVAIPDLMLPGQNGLQVCRKIRRVANLPILILTTREGDLDHAFGLEPGVDNYVIGPIEPLVLLAHSCVLMYRHAPLLASPENLILDKPSIDQRRREAELEGRDTGLITMESELLWLLANQTEEIPSRNETLNQIRSIGSGGLDRSIGVCINKLRSKLKDNPREPIRIKTVWGKGYPLNPLGWEL